MKMTFPMISVCLATYNGERYIREQLLSIIPQLSPSDEIIISDDGSADTTLSVIESLNHPQIRVVCNTGRRGYTPNFENALRHAKGDYIFLCDQDDVWLPTKVQTCMQALRQSDFVITDACVVDRHLEVLHPSFWEFYRSRQGFLNNLVRFGYLGCCMAFRRSVLERALPFPECDRKASHDNWLALVGMLYYSMSYVPSPQILFRRHDCNTSLATKQKNITTVWFKVKYRLYLLVQLAKRCFANT